ncbi:MAG: HlyD family efflux transporter periplasmic adaptor subunit [Planctomycetota bacterium]|nr:MAG: HlyD family efflux transporter periplasmic adaptor subunit [Planctomycetota bacterium]
MSSVDPRSVEEARQQIRALVDEIDQLSKSDLAEADFFQGLLERVLTAMGAVAGLVWLIGEGGRLEAASHIGLPNTGIGETPQSQESHGRLVQSVANSQSGLVVPPRGELNSPGGPEGAANPTDLIVVMAPIDCSGKRAGLLEVFHQPNQPDVERGSLTFLEQVSGVAGGYLQRRQLRTLDEQQGVLAQVDRFSRAVHESLDPIATAYTLANEGRRIIGCDRVGVLVKRRGRMRLEAVSGQESIERRATAVQTLETLVRVVAKAGDPLWHPDASRELPPQIEEELEIYIDESHATMIAIIPLERPRPTPVVKAGGVDAVAIAKAEAAPRGAPAPIAALVAEWFTATSFDGGRRPRVELVAEHAKLAIANSLDHTSLPLYGLISLLGKSKVLTNARNLPRTLLATIAIVGSIAGLIFIPAELRLEGKGTLEPVHRRDVFAGIEGVVERIEEGVEHGSVVNEGQVLATLRNTDLAVALIDVLGRKASTEEQLVSTQRSLLEDNKLSADERTRLAGRAAQFRREIASLEEQRQLYERKQTDLEIKSPINGVIVTWQVRDRLILRPVEKGQSLMSVADKTGPWELEIHMPDDRLGHVNRAAEEARAAGHDLRVDYILATDPGTRHFGTVREIHEQAEIRGEEGNTVLVRITIDPSRHEKEELGAGASVTARIACGKRALGYVWFHDVLGFIQSQILFRLW